jgi:putative NADH-flavin reductase
MSKIIVFGATGGTGKILVAQALAKGFEVTAILRNPDSLDLQHHQLKIVKGDVLLPSSFANEITGKDAVISCLGNGKNLGPTTVYSKGIENILQAMRGRDVHRLLCISAGGVEATKEMGFFVRTITALVLQRILKNPYADMLLMEQELERSDLDWTILRPARLTDRPLTKKYRVAVRGHIRKPWSIGRADLSHYLLQVINDQQTFRSKPEISY